MSIKWQIRETDQVLRQFKKLGDQQKKQYRQAIKTLASSDNPRKLGTFKLGKKYAAYYTSLVLLHLNVFKMGCSSRGGACH